MTWTALQDRATGYLFTAANHNELLGASGNLEELKLHTHDGTNGAGADLKRASLPTMITDWCIA